MTISDEDKKEIIRLCNIQRAEPKDKVSIRRMMILYVDNGFSMCDTCAPQVRAAFNRLKEWAKKNNLWNGD